METDQQMQMRYISVPCPTCKARPGEACYAPRKVTGTHVSRQDRSRRHWFEQSATVEQPPV